MAATAANLRPKPSNTLPVAAFAICVLASLMLFLVPAFVIRPFRPQSAAGLSLAMTVRQLAPLWTAVATAAAMIIAVLIWRRVSKPGRALLVVGMLLGCVSAAMSRINYFEWMFHPVGAPGFDSPQSAHLDDGEMVMAVHVGADTRAYPIRAMAYHHVVNDVVDGVPIVVTY